MLSRARQLEQRSRIAAELVVAFALQTVRRLINARKICRRVDFPQQMLHRRQPARKQPLDFLSLFRFILQRSSHRL